MKVAHMRMHGTLAKARPFTRSANPTISYQRGRFCFPEAKKSPSLGKCSLYPHSIDPLLAFTFYCTILSPRFHRHFCAFTDQLSTVAEVTEQVHSMDKELPADTSHENSNPVTQIMDKARDAGVGVDTGEGSSNAISEAPSTSDPASGPSTNKPKPAFVKVINLGQDVMLIAWLQAFLGLVLYT